MTSFRNSIGGATALVREGRLAEATEAIRRALGGAVGPAPEEAAGSAPMRDVTPRPAALPGAEEAGGRAPERPKARRTTPAAEADAPGGSPRRGGSARRARPFGLGEPAGGWTARPRIDLSALDARVRPAARDVPLPDGARFEERRHEGPHGAMGYRLYVPASVAPGAPLVVMLHGCTQDPEDFARGTRMNAVAEEAGALVAYPRQESSRNPNRCWSWFEPAQTGASGEAAMIAALAAEASRAEGGDPSRMFAAGLSAGGAMAAALGAAHPGTFRAVGVHSGLPAGAASDMAGAFAAMGGRAGDARALPVPAIVVHGTADRTVAPVNAERIARAGRSSSAAKPRVRKGEANGRRYERIRLAAERGAGAVELWRIDGLAHAWSGGSADGSYADPSGPDASREMMRFFLEHAA